MVEGDDQLSQMAVINSCRIHPLAEIDFGGEQGTL